MDIFLVDHLIPAADSMWAGPLPLDLGPTPLRMCTSIGFNVIEILLRVLNLQKYFLNANALYTLDRFGYGFGLFMSGGTRVKIALANALVALLNPPPPPSPLALAVSPAPAPITDLFHAIPAHELSTFLVDPAAPIPAQLEAWNAADQAHLRGLRALLHLMSPSAQVELLALMFPE
ncbi:hypothetical protein HK100_012013 [Physocladia obscura]|uniref:Uncharacterized protein n=1 Tax=Physocladia obscura TaxID=109957 RepID=A0AAD5T0H0_9FUNG|nr:hypothetical protein HK100_012013 [Physocladia obscura]